MTQSEFDRLPMLLVAAQARAALGVDKETLREMRGEFPGLAIRLKRGRWWRYRKMVVAKILAGRIEA